VQPTKIELRLTARPASAKFFLDNVPLESNPFTGKFPADGAQHLIRAEARGYTSQQQFARFQENMTIEFELEKKASQSRPSNKPSTRLKSAAPSPKPPSKPAGESTAKPKRPLSESDPWSN
jgi:serine/threonine-protein kinase